jgi:hypothetical protein
MREKRHPKKRRFAIEQLESRWAMTAEGQSFDLDRTFDTSDLFGSKPTCRRADQNKV